jgi:hypothetical protein
MGGVMRRFYLNRLEDVSGNSGTGRVAEGCLFSDGRAVVHWMASNNSLGVSSTVVYDGLVDVEKVHGHGGKTQIVFLDRCG